MVGANFDATMHFSLGVLAVVLGLNPVPDANIDSLNVDYAAVKNRVGPIFQSADQRGRIRLRGIDRRTAEIFDVVIDEEGRVVAQVGEKVIMFKILRSPT